MGTLPSDISEMIWNLKQQLLDIIDSASQAEFTLFDNFGETDRTIDYLEQDYRQTRQKRLQQRLLKPN